MKQYEKPEAEYLSIFTEAITLDSETGNESSIFDSIEDEDYFE